MYMTERSEQFLNTLHYFLLKLRQALLDHRAQLMVDHMQPLRKLVLPTQVVPAVHVEHVPRFSVHLVAY